MWVDGGELTYGGLLCGRRTCVRCIAADEYVSYCFVMDEYVIRCIVGNEHVFRYIVVDNMNDYFKLDEHVFVCICCELPWICSLVGRRCVRVHFVGRTYM